MDISVLTYTGRRVDLKNFTHEDVSVLDIAVSLSRQRRYAGHTNVSWSVGQHLMLCVLLAEVFEYDDRAVKEVFLHDVPETWLQDIISPIKRNLTTMYYHSLEGSIHNTCRSYFGLDILDQNYNDEIKNWVHDIDVLAYMIESATMREGYSFTDDVIEKHQTVMLNHLINIGFNIPEEILVMPDDDVGVELVRFMNQMLSDKMKVN